MVSLQSDSIDQIATALSIAQGDMAPLHKNAKNDYIGNRFADLSAVREVCVTALSKNLIAVTQMIRPHEGEAPAFTAAKPRKDKDGNTRYFDVPVQILGYLRTQLTHSSGQWFASELPIVCNWGDPHALGGTVTYLRRYALAAMCGVAQDDDDAESAKGRNGHAKKQAQAPRTDRFEDATPVSVGRGSPDPAPAPTAGLPSPAPVPAAIAAELPQSNGRRGAPERPQTGLQLSTYCGEQKTDPDLKHWIVERFKHRSYPVRITEWTPAQVEAAWPDIRDHLRKKQLTAQMRSEPVSV
jgi:hypothetical protein